MRPMFEADEYSTILFIDSMVGLEAKPLKELPWKELDASGPILILVVPQVNAEIDKRKRDGRLGRRAREFNRLITPAAESGRPFRIVEGTPSVDIAIAACDRINWAALGDDLDPELGDARLVAEILHVSGLPPERRVLLSHDINPISMARRRGLETRKLPEHWLLEPEPSPQERELTRLKGRLRELEAKLPHLLMALTFNAEPPVCIFCVRPLNVVERQQLVRQVIEDNPEPSPQSILLPDPGIGGRYHRYCNVRVPKYAESLHRYLEVHYGQISFHFSIRNTSDIQAENLVVRLTALHGALHNKFSLHQIFGPSAPQPDPNWIYGNGLRNLALDRLGQKVGRHDMEFVIGPDRGPKIEIHCADFRQGSIWDFNGVGIIDPHADGPFSITAEVTASNLPGVYRESVEIGFTTAEMAPFDLIDYETSTFKQALPLQEEFDRAMQSQDLDWFSVVVDDFDQ